ncbi:hypothetical protein NQ024_15405, partial [Corynebacterium sp. 35RC1]|nr:hypothetical protein [Corynebacterium sp. 35RC1]
INAELGALGPGRCDQRGYSMRLERYCRRVGESDDATLIWGRFALDVTLIWGRLRDLPTLIWGQNAPTIS